MVYLEFYDQCIHLSIRYILGGSGSYTDHVIAYSIGKTTSGAKAILEDMSAAIIRFAAAHYLAIILCKTQVMWAGHQAMPALTVGDFTVDEATVDLIGVEIDKGLNPLLFKQQLTAGRRILELIRHLMWCYLPQT